MRALVTGGSGFLGSHIVALLLERGHSVRILDLNPPEREESKVEFIQGSITDAPIVSTATRAIDVVFHVAAKAGLWARDDREFYEINDVGARTVLEAAQANGVARIVHTSTESILKCAQKAPDAPTDETVEPQLSDMVGPYCVGKFLAEQRAMEAAKAGAPVVVVNPTVPVGPGDRNLTPPTRMLLGFLNGENGAFLETTLNLTDVRDIAQGHIAAWERGRIGERYILGGENVRLSDLLRRLEEVSGLRMPKRKVPYWVAHGFALLNETWSNTVSGQPPRAPLTGVKLARSPMIFDNRKARVELGLSFRPLERSLKDALVWMGEQGLLKRSPDWERVGAAPRQSAES